MGSQIICYVNKTHVRGPRNTLKNTGNEFSVLKQTQKPLHITTLLLVKNHKSLASLLSISYCKAIRNYK